MIEEIRAGLQSVRVLISGRVQGVGFRHAARKQAEALGIDAHPVNREDGTVEIEVRGEEDAVRRFVEWSRQGPPRARVDDVVVIQRGGQPRGFS